MALRRDQHNYAAARRLRRDLSLPEALLWRELRRRAGGVKFRRQHPVGPYICDFACVEAGVIVELDGSQHVERSDYDFCRDAFLGSRGFRVLRFWNNDVQSQTQAILETIYEALHRPELGGRFD